MTDYRALCIELVDIITAHANPDDYAVGYVAGVLTRARAALTDEPAVPSALADTHYEWELEDAKGEWQAGGSSNNQGDVEREGMRYLQTYAQDGPHKLIIRQHTTQTINEIING